MKYLTPVILLLFFSPIQTALAAPAQPGAAKYRYPLDGVKREGKKTPRGLRCPKVEMVRYKGDVIRYHKPVRVYPEFIAHLEAFEKIVEQAALEIYGRAPRRIRHVGTYNCRRISGYPNLISEHGVANAIDISGFDFGSLPRADRASAPRDLPKKLTRAFKVRLIRHWRETPNDHHSRFLDLVARRVVEAQIFRVVLGPSYPGHKDHFHFDMAPYEMVKVW